jgi:hypothetical protein
VVGINRAKRQVLSLDPSRGPRQNSFEGFAREWIPTGEVTIVIFDDPKTDLTASGSSSDRAERSPPTPPPSPRTRS